MRIAVRGLVKVFPSRRGEVRALDGIDLDVEPGELLCVKGPSGGGKTTLLLALGGLLRPSAGTVEIDGEDLYARGPRGLEVWRSRDVGFVFQLFHLVPYLSVRENVLLGPGNGRGREGFGDVRELLERLGLAHRAGHRPSELSVGEQQRVAVARALANGPRLVLADEPTGNLDPENAAEVLRHLATFRDGGGTVVVVTHGEEAARHADRVVQLRAGRLGGGVP